MAGSKSDIPDFCQYSAGVCDQNLTDLQASGNFFLYPSEPDSIKTTIKLALEDLRNSLGSYRWTSWEDMKVSGQIIFCEICKGVFTADVVIADISTLNFNVLFEIGFAIGRGIPVILIRDTSYIKDSQLFRELGFCTVSINVPYFQIL